LQKEKGQMTNMVSLELNKKNAKLIAMNETKRFHGTFQSENSQY
jgi:hypothetical protein